MPSIDLILSDYNLFLFNALASVVFFVSLIVSSSNWSAGKSIRSFWSCKVNIAVLSLFGKLSHELKNINSNSVIINIMPLRVACSSNKTGL